MYQTKDGQEGTEINDKSEQINRIKNKLNETNKCVVHMPFIDTINTIRKECARINRRHSSQHPIPSSNNLINCFAINTNTHKKSTQ